MAMGWGTCGRRSVSSWADCGMPVMGSSLDLNCEMVHDGETRRSEDETSELIITVTSAAVVKDIFLGLGVRGGIVRWKLRLV